MTYGTDAAVTHLSNAYCYLDMQPSDHSAKTLTATSKRGFITRWNRLSASGKVQLFRRLHSDVCNVLLYLLPDVRLQIQLTNAPPSFCLINKSVDSKTVFKFLDPQLLVRRVRPNPATLLAHNSTLIKGSLARYNLTRVELTTFTFSDRSKSLSIDNAVLLPKSETSFVHHR